MATGTQKRAELRKLAKVSKDNIFDMLRIANELLADDEYVDSFGGEPQLIEVFENEEFSHFGGTPTLPNLLLAYRCNPSKRTWAEHKFSIWAMIDLAKPVNRGEPSEKINWKKRCKEAEARVEQLETDLATAKEEISRLSGQPIEAAELRGKVSAMEHMLLSKVA